MTRTYSTITWGLALIVSAVVLAWQQSLPWALAAAGAVAVITGVVAALIDDEVARNAKMAAAERVKADRAAGESF